MGTSLVRKFLELPRASIFLGQVFVGQDKVDTEERVATEGRRREGLTSMFERGTRRVSSMVCSMVCSMVSRGGVLVLFLFLVVGATEGQRLRVGVVPFLKPFVFDDPIVGTTGFDVDLLNALMDEMGREYDLVPFDTIPEVLESLKNGANSTVALAVSALTVTLPRQQAFDFSQPYQDSGLSVLVSASNTSKSAVFDALFSPLFLTLIFVFVLGILVFGHCLWLFERRNNSEFSKSYADGVFDGIWWSSVTATTVGYGDISPHSRLGKLSAIMIMFWGLVVTSFFVGTISSALTLSILTSSINGVNDLAGRRVGVIQDQSSALYAKAHIPAEFFQYTSLNAAVDALLSGAIEAVVDDTPLLLYYAAQESFGRARVVGDVFDPQRYAFGLPFQSSIAEEVNVALAKLEVTGVVPALYSRWFQPTHGETGEESDSGTVHVSNSLVTGFWRHHGDRHGLDPRDVSRHVPVHKVQGGRSTRPTPRQRISGRQPHPHGRRQRTHARPSPQTLVDEGRRSRCRSLRVEGHGPAVAGSAGSSLGENGF